MKQKTRTTEDLIEAGQLTREGEAFTKDRIVLNDEGLFERLVKEIGKKVVGEERTIESILLSCCGLWVGNNQISSYNLMINSLSGSGKDFIVKKVLEILPQKFWVKRTRISPTALTYWHNAKYEPEWDWSEKILYLEDVSDNIFNHEVFKTMCSSGSNATIVIKQRAYDLEVKGKPVMLVTSASITPSSEMVRRFNILELDESEEQTKKIKQRQSQIARTGMEEEYSKELCDCFNYLKKCNVVIPFADEVIGVFPDNLIIRTALDRFFDYIRASCSLHQYQRVANEEGYLIAVPQDYSIARNVLLKTTSNKYMTPLTRNQKMILDVLENKKDEWFSITDLEKETPITRRELYRQMDRLVNAGLVKRDTRPKERGKDETIYNSRVTFKIEIPTWKELMANRLKLQK